MMQKFFEKCFLWTENAEPNDPTWNVRVCSINIVVVWFSEVAFRHWLKAKFTWIAWNFNGPNGIQSTSHWSQKSCHRKSANKQNFYNAVRLFEQAVFFHHVCLNFWDFSFIHLILYSRGLAHSIIEYTWCSAFGNDTHTQRYAYTQLTKLVKVSFSKNRIHKICSKNEPNIIIIMMKEKPEKNTESKKKLFEFIRRHSFVVVFGIFVGILTWACHTHIHACNVHTVS